MSTWQILNGALSLTAATLLSWVVLHPRIKEGVLIKLGLVAMIFSLLSTAALTLTDTENWEALWRAGFVLRCGLALTSVGVLFRAYGIRFRGRCLMMRRRRSTDWLI